MAGKLTVDTLAAIMLFLSLSGLIHTLSPRKARPRRAGARARARRGLMLWHNRLGWLLLIPLLLLTLTGWLLRPPGLIAIARVKVKPIPFSALDSDNPWHDKLRTLRHDDALGDWLLGTSDGFYSLRSLTGVPKPEDTQPPVSVMGVNAQQKDSAGRWIIGSFTGLYLWDRHSRHITDYFTGLEAKPITGKPVGQHAISGYSADFAPGGFPIDYVSGSNAIAMPGWMATLPMSLRNVCVEAHTGRIFTLLGKGSALYICVAGIAIAWCLWSGWKCHWPIRAKRKKR